MCLHRDISPSGRRHEHTTGANFRPIVFAREREREREIETRKGNEVRGRFGSAFAAPKIGGKWAAVQVMMISFLRAADRLFP